jgi:hypothetical protein
MRYIILFLFTSSICLSQSISKQVIGSSGLTFDDGTIKLSHTTGELIVGAMSDQQGTYQLSNGYYPSLDLSTLSTESPSLDLQVKVFPNPVTELLYISHPTEQFFDVAITDISGKQILQTTHQKKLPLSVQNFTSGTYFVIVTTKDSKQTNTYKIIKR